LVFSWSSRWPVPIVSTIEEMFEMRIAQSTVPM
jgi:hypothetical protein